MTRTTYKPANTVLISGASIAGPTLAHWLRRFGFTPTVIERSPVPRPGGQAVDVRGVALEVADRMGVLPQLRAAKTGMRGMAFVDADGVEVMSTTEMSLTGGPTASPDVEILRDDLSEILLAATEGVEYVYGDTITGLTQHDGGVDVTFASGEPRTFDLVIGADGLHSGVRRIAFGPESDCISHLGSYLAVFSTPNFLDLDHWQVFQQSPGKMSGIYSARHNTEARVVMGYESEQIEYDHRDVDQQKKLIATAFAGDRWEVPRLIELMADAPDFYFDSMSQIHLASWSRGRVGLVGDAGYCASPLSGQGTSLAMVGAYVLAGELRAAGGDHVAGFARYQAEMTDYVRANQQLALTNAEATRQAAEQLAAGTDGADDAAEEQIEEHWVATAATALTLKDYAS
ncbi:FAD-dependent monooxygenase [Pseudonocardia sp. GCM10023141]|uniref:FAD-dependent monooxygenase n=1 Tax=Pseudonocardia sp. GCM10023141 TaxID=3252653 RepID=UPI0036246637